MIIKMPVGFNSSLKFLSYFSPRFVKVLHAPFHAFFYASPPLVQVT